ncbi:MAG: chorismate-binding protein [bacterium]|nr:chorismate-binding protein [bacterium]MDD5353782.1 chorismate-binding protein [bacterium]MDD5757184.1 chorismate-binding protein [bacterium]
MIFVLLDTAAKDKENKTSLLFNDPHKIITCRSSGQLDICLDQVIKATNKGWYAAGFISYEAGSHLQGLDKTNRSYSFPLLWFGLFSKPVMIKSFQETKPYLVFPKAANHSILNKIHLNTTKEKYCRDIVRIKKLIAQGQTYQVNYTMKYKFKFSGSPGNLYHRLRAIQPVSYGAFIDTGDRQILSFSPELFLRRNNDIISVQPMKGTEALCRHTNLPLDPKNQAENLMITDLMRNDLGKISRTGTVQTYDLFKTHKYSTLWQMTSSVQSQLRPKISWREIFGSLFPCGSVTGTPKISTMRIIKDLEKEERNIYTGAIGYISPDKQSVFNVAIRTILLQGQQGEMGIGGGITYDSDPGQELAECQLKAAFLLKSNFQLIETMAWSYPAGISLLPLHLNRLKKSAVFFGFPYNQQSINKAISEFLCTLNKKNSCKIRLLLKNNGAVSLQAEAIPPSAPGRTLVAISTLQTDPDDPFLRHKTTERSLYDRELKHYKKGGYYDVLFTNNRGEITEGAISNIFIKKGLFYYTPPLACGLLPGVFRTYFIRRHHNMVKEKILCPEDLYSADAIFLTNAVRGIVQVKLDR